MAYTANDENTLNREISSLVKLKDTYPKYLLTTDFDSANINGIRKINVIYWLLGNRHDLSDKVPSDKVLRMHTGDSESCPCVS